MKQHRQHRNVVLLTCIATLLLCIASASAIAAEVYTWTDADGNVHYGDKPPTGQNVDTVKFRNTAPASNAGTDGYSDGQDSGAELSAAEIKRQEINDKRQQQRVVPRFPQRGGQWHLLQ